MKIRPPKKLAPYPIVMSLLWVDKDLCYKVTAQTPLISFAIMLLATSTTESHFHFNNKS